MDKMTINMQKIMLNIGCGHNYIDGWINIDDDPLKNINKLDMTVGLTEDLPFNAKSVDVIFDKSFFEKLNLGNDSLRKCVMNYQRILKPNGLLKIVMADNALHEGLEQTLKQIGFNNLEIIYLDQLSEKKYNPSNNKIPCYVLVFFDYETTKKSLDFYTKYSDRLDIRVVENHSDYTEGHIKPYIMDLLKQEKISNYYLFDENIGFNAIEKVMIQDAEYLNDFKYFMITDGDLVSETNGWIDEQIEILEQNQEVVVSGARLNMSNLPSEKDYPGASQWVQPSINIEGKNYFLNPTGWLFALIKTDYFFLMLRVLKRAGMPLSDGYINRCAKEINKLWVRTKKTEAYHLTWDTYSQLDHPYTKWKNSLTYSEIWEHKKYCDFALFNKNNIKSIV